MKFLPTTLREPRGATCWQGGEKLQDAYYILQELADKNASTPLLLNAMASCQLGQGRHDDADSSLQEAVSKVSQCSLTSLVQIGRPARRETG